jgi:hypothetical protein
VASFHHPALRQEEETLGAFRPLHNLPADFSPGPQGPQPGDQVSGIGLIRPEEPSPRTLVAEHRQEPHGPLAVLPMARRHDDGEE